MISMEEEMVDGVLDDLEGMKVEKNKVGIYDCPTFVRFEAK